MRGAPVTTGLRPGDGREPLVGLILSRGPVEDRAESNMGADGLRHFMIVPSLFPFCDRMVPLLLDMRLWLGSTESNSPIASRVRLIRSVSYQIHS